MLQLERKTSSSLKTSLFIFLILALSACSNNRSKVSDAISHSTSDTILVHDTIYNSNGNNWQQGFNLSHDLDTDSIWGKPVKFYFDNPNCSPIAKDFYEGQFRPGDNYTTAALLNLVTTNDNSLRPFYRWCLEKTIDIQDGALAEYTGAPARRYVEKFPKEFFKYIDTDKSLGKYKDWVGAIIYSGFYDNEDYNNAAAIRKQMSATMKKNCAGCDIRLQQRIDSMARDCFP